MSGNGRALLTVDEADGFAVRLTPGDGRSGPVDPEAGPVSAPLPGPPADPEPVYPKCHRAGNSR